eukprot:Awhi_evm1s12234
MHVSAIANDISLPVQAELFIDTQCSSAIGSVTFYKERECQLFDAGHSGFISKYNLISDQRDVVTYDNADCGMSARPDFVMYYLDQHRDLEGECIRNFDSSVPLLRSANTSVKVTVKEEGDSLSTQFDYYENNSDCQGTPTLSSPVTSIAKKGGLEVTTLGEFSWQVGCDMEGRNLSILGKNEGLEKEISAAQKYQVHDQIVGQCQIGKSPGTTDWIDVHSLKLSFPADHEAIAKLEKVTVVDFIQKLLSSIF